jgi:hypothetical protein
MVPSNRRALEVDLRRTGGPIVQDGGEVLAGPTSRGTFVRVHRQEMALLAIESNRRLDVCSRCALPLSAKYDFIERYSGFSCVSRHGHMLKISPFLP